MKPPAIKFSATDTKRPGNIKDDKMDVEEVLSDMGGDRLDWSSLKTVKVEENSNF